MINTLQPKIAEYYDLEKIQLSAEELEKGIKSKYVASIKIGPATKFITILVYDEAIERDLFNAQKIQETMFRVIDYMSLNIYASGEVPKPFYDIQQRDLEEYGINGPVESLIEGTKTKFKATLLHTLPSQVELMQGKKSFWQKIGDFFDDFNY